MEIANTETPLMKQYRRIKSQLPDNTILFFRLGDFYEMFYEDAKIAAPILDVALTKRQHVRCAACRIMRPICTLRA